MVKLVLKIILILLVVLAGAVYWLIGTDSGLKTMISQSQKWVPELTIKAAQGRLANKIALAKISYQADANTLITIESLVLSWQSFDLLSSKVQVDEFSVDGINIKLSGEAATEEKPSSEPLELPNIVLPLPIYIDGIHITNVTSTDADNKSTVLVKRVDASLSLEKSTFKLNHLYVEHSDTDHIELNGQVVLSDLYPTNLAYKWAAAVPDFKTVSGAGTIDGDLAELNIKQQLNKPIQSSQVIVLNDVIEQLKWQADIRIPKLNVAELSPEQKGVASDVKLIAKGDLSSANIDLSGQFTDPQLSTLTINTHAESADFEQWAINSKITAPSEMAISLDGKILDVSSNPTANLALNWQQLTWPIVEDIKVIRSEQGQLTFNGNAEQFKLNMNADLEAQSKQATVSIDAHGSDKQIDVSELAINGFGGKATFVGQVLIDTLTTMTGDLKLKNINPGLIAPDWPGKLSGGITLSASVSDENTDINVDKLDIKGQLRDRPLRLKGNLSYVDKQLTIPVLQLYSGKSLLKVDGYLKDNIAINWLLVSPDLVDFYPDVSGQLNGSGTVTGTAEHPIYSAKLAGQTIAYSDLVSIAKLDSDIKLDMSKQGLLNAKVNVSGLSAESVKDVNSQLTFSGTQSVHQLNLDVATDSVGLSTIVKGGLDSEVWTGQFDKLEIDLPDSVPWVLTDKSQIIVAQDKVKFEQHCLQSEQSALCIAANYLQNQWQASGSLKHFTLDKLHGLVEQTEGLTGQLDGQFDVAAKGDYPNSGKGQFNLKNGRIDLAKSGLDSEKIIDLTQANISYELSANKTEASINITPKLEGVSSITGSVVTSGIETMVSTPDKAALQGEFKTSIADLSIFDGLTSDYENLKGELKANLSLSGTVQKAVVQGSVLLDQVSVDVPSAGLSLSEIKARAEGGLDDGLKLSFSAKSGEGTLAANGDVIFTDEKWNVRSHIKGENFEVMNVPEIYALASPDITLTLDDKSMDISGTLTIPEAVIEPTKFNSSVSPSKDVVVVTNKTDAEESAFPTNVNVQLIFGDKINLTALGFTGRLTGDLLATGDASKQLLGKGSIVIKDGIYNAYGKKLKIDDGQIIFSGGPIDNPGLDIKAIKKSDDYTVGVHISGLADGPEIKLFSTPIMSDDDVLAYLVLGKPMSEATVADAAILASAAAGIGGGGGDGVAQKFGLDSLSIEGEDKDDASVELGKNLSPNLYVGYGIGIFEPVSTVNIRYKLNKIWSLRAESGEETGVDLLYTHER